MSRHYQPFYQGNDAEFQAKIAAAVRKARKERAETLSRMLNSLWDGLRRGFSAQPVKSASADQVHGGLPESR